MNWTSGRISSHMHRTMVKKQQHLSCQRDCEILTTTSLDKKQLRCLAWCACSSFYWRRNFPGQSALWTDFVAPQVFRYHLHVCSRGFCSSNGISRTLNWRTPCPSQGYFFFKISDLLISTTISFAMADYQNGWSTCIEDTALLTPIHYCLLFFVKTLHCWRQSIIDFFSLWRHYIADVNPLLSSFLCEDTTLLTSTHYCLLFFVKTLHCWRQSIIVFFSVWRHCIADTNPLLSSFLCEDTTLLTSTHYCLLFFVKTLHCWRQFIHFLFHEYLKNGVQNFVVTYCPLSRFMSFWLGLHPSIWISSDSQTFLSNLL